MKKLLPLLMIIITSVMANAADQAVGWDKATIGEGKILYKDNILTIDGNAVPTEDVSVIRFNTVKNDDKPTVTFKDNVSPVELIKRANILKAKYPDSGRLVLLDEGELKMNADKSQYSRSRYTVLVCNEKELSNAQLSFYNNEGEYETKILMARSISPDGKVSYLQESDITRTYPSQGLQFFSGRKDAYIMKAVIPNVQVGSIIDYVYETVESKPEDPNQFYTGWYFGTDVPVYESIVTLTVPQNVPYYWAISNFGKFSDKPQIVTKGGYTSYTFRRGECEPFVAEPYCPPQAALLPVLSGSTFKDQTYLSKWLSSFFKERMVCNDEMRAAVAEVINKANAESEEDKISALYRFVQDYVHYRSVKTSISSGMAGHPAAETFSNRYGDCIDKSIFFATILRDIGIDAYPVIVYTNDNPRVPYDKIGSRAGNHAINEIHLADGRVIYLDSTSTTDKYPYFRSDDHGIPAWNPILNTIREIEPPDVSYNTQKFECDITVAADGNGTVKQTNTYRGNWESSMRYYFSNMNEAEVKGLFTSIVSNNYPGSRLTGYTHDDGRDFTKDFSMEYNYQATDILKSSGPYMVFRLPFKSDYGETTLQHRKYPIKYATTFGENRTLTLHLPKELSLSGLPEELNIENKYFSYSGKFESVSNSDGETVTFTSHYVRKATLIPPTDYDDYRRDVLQIDHFIKSPIIFTRSENVR